MNQTLMNLVQQKANSLYEKITLQRRKNESKLLYFWKTIDSVYLGCNDAFANVAGYKNSDELIGKSDADLICDQYTLELYLAGDREVINNVSILQNSREPLGSCLRSHNQIPFF